MELTADHMLMAYRNGIFPMAESRTSQELHWYDPYSRGILPLDTFHLPARLKRTVKQHKFSVTINQNFQDVMAHCATTRPESWINDKIFSLYNELHRRGDAHSVEVWRGNDLVGGLYGVAIGGGFFGESMFSTERDASKVALVHLVARLKTRGYTLCDTQFITSHLAQFGAKEITRSTYHKLLVTALKLDVQFFNDGDVTMAGNAGLVDAALAGGLFDGTGASGTAATGAV